MCTQQGHLNPLRSLSGAEFSLCLKSSGRAMERQEGSEKQVSVPRQLGMRLSSRAAAITGPLDRPLLAIDHCRKLMVHQSCIGIQRGFTDQWTERQAEVHVERPMFCLLKVFYLTDDDLRHTDVRWHALSHSHGTWVLILTC